MRRETWDVRRETWDETMKKQHKTIKPETKQHTAYTISTNHQGFKLYVAWKQTKPFRVLLFSFSVTFSGWNVYQSSRPGNMLYGILAAKVTQRHLQKKKKYPVKFSITLRFKRKTMAFFLPPSPYPQQSYNKATLHLPTPSSLTIKPH